MEHLTIAYMTNRFNPAWRWFFDSLEREFETDGGQGPVKVVVVDFYADDRSLPVDWTHHTAPKPCVWQGKHRLTTKDYFAAANARNTALCLAPDGWIAWVDDLSVLMPGWLARVREAMSAGYVALGAYRKVLGLRVEGGRVVDYQNHPHGLDSRWNYGSDTEAVPHGAGALFGCSLASPVELFLQINGWDESCDGMGYEDTVCGYLIQNARQEMRYDRRMLTLESEEMHHIEQAFLRIDKPNAIGGRYKDASHAVLDKARRSTRADNPFDVRDLRRDVLAGEPFPIPTDPMHHWPDNQPLREM